MMLARILAELKRRRVLRVAGVYIVLAIAVLQGADVLVEALGLPPWALTLVAFLAILGLPVVVTLTWVFEVTPEGVKRTGRDPATRSPSASTLGLSTLMVFALLVLAGGYAFLGDGAGGNAGEEAERSIAVLPFTDMSPDRDQGYFSDGVTEDILTKLAQVSGLRVISRTSVMTYKGSSKPLRQIGEELGVAYILEGSVRRIGDRVRITGQLIDARTDEHLWAQSYDRDLTDVFAVQGEIAGEIAHALSVRLSAGERSRLQRSTATGSIAAYELYLRGRQYFSMGSGSEAQRESQYVAAAALFRQSLAEDSSFAPAWAGLARSSLNQQTLRGGGQYDSVVAYSKRAIALDPNLAAGYVALGNAYWARGRDDDAIREFRRALELEPNNPDAVAASAAYESDHGRLDEALRGYKRAAALEPTARLTHHLEVGWTYLALRDLDKAEAWFRNALEDQPNPGMLECYLARLAGERGEHYAVRRHIERQLEYAPDVPFAWKCAAINYLVIGEYERARELYERYATAVLNELEAPDVELAFLERRNGDPAAAGPLLDRAESRWRRIIDTGRTHWSLHFELARIAAVRADAGAAARHLRAAFDGGFRKIHEIEPSPLFDGVRSDTRFRAVVAEMRADVDRMRERVRREGW